MHRFVLVSRLVTYRRDVSQTMDHPALAAMQTWVWGSLQASGGWSTPDGSMRAAMSQLNLLARAYHRKQSVKLARTIVDLVRCEEIQSVQPAEALQHRPELMIG